jgi:hypothetical protein
MNIDISYRYLLILEKRKQIPFATLLIEKNRVKLKIIDKTNNLRFELFCNKNGWKEETLNNIFLDYKKLTNP